MMALGAIGASTSGLAKLVANQELMEFFTGFLEDPSEEHKIASLKAFGEILERK